jgi:hypothetical protein
MLSIRDQTKRGLASCPRAERPNERVRERPGSGLESHRCGEGFLLILNEKRIRLQDAFDGFGDLMVR